MEAEHRCRYVLFRTGDEIQKFTTHDGPGLQPIQQKGIKTGIITWRHKNGYKEGF